jgi:dihydrofolate reductase
MGRTTFETVCGFDIDWPYNKPVFVLSNTMTEIPKKFKNNAQLAKGTLTEILAQIHDLGHNHLYIDGGTRIQGFLKEDLIDTLTITTIPVLLGGDAPLFGERSNTLKFHCTSSKIYLNKIVQNKFKRVR